jgi:hypothetical protein
MLWLTVLKASNMIVQTKFPFGGNEPVDIFESKLLVSIAIVLIIGATVYFGCQDATKLNMKDNRA